MELKIKWQSQTGEWVEFPVADIMNNSRNHAIALFSQKIPVIVNQDGTYITNSKVLQKQYQSNRSPVKMFVELEPDPRKLGTVGFL